MVFLHHSLASYQKWDEFINIIGGRYHLEDEKKEVQDKMASTYKHDVDLDVKIADPNHPITRDLKDFTIHDEAYGGFTVLPKVHPLLTTNHTESGKFIAWTNKYAKSRVVYIQLGHDHYAFEDPNYRRLVKQAIDWVRSE
jgi:type 1 glutamine amidotransferase